MRYLVLDKERALTCFAEINGKRAVITDTKGSLIATLEKKDFFRWIKKCNYWLPQYR